MKTIGTVTAFDIGPAEIEILPPWLIEPLDEWSIVGMNHYKASGEKRLFVAMTCDRAPSLCIKAEGPDDAALWAQLVETAKLFGEKRIAKVVTWGSI